MAERMVKHYRDLARKDLEAGIEVPGWKLSEPVPVRRIKDVSKAWDAINESGLLLATQFISACKINIGEIEELIREAGGLTAKAAKEKVNELLEDVIELDTRRPSLEKVK
jgi:hypothetical protein